MVVIVIIGLIYTLAVAKLQRVHEEKMSPDFLNLKEYLGSFLNTENKSVRLLCLDDCQECSVMVDGEELERIESFFDDSVTLYSYNTLYGAQKVPDAVYFNKEGIQEDVCFSLLLYKRGISEQVFIVYNDKAYDYTTYFDKVKEYNSLEELVEAKEQLAREVMQ